MSVCSLKKKIVIAFSLVFYSHRQTVSSDVFTYDPEMLNIRSTDILDGSSGDIKADSSNTTEEFPAVQKDADAILPRGTATI